MIEWLIANQFTLIGLIFMTVLGPAVGNYACSVVYRLPRGKTPFERHPYCGNCNASLKPIDLFPILSWFMTRGKCRYCGDWIPGIYTVIEIACGILFIAYFLHFGISEQFLLYTSYGVFVIILAAIHWQQGWISSSIYGYAMTMIVIARALAEHTIYGAIQSGFVMLMLMLVLLRLDDKKTPPFEKPWIWWFVLMGTLLPINQWHFLLPVYIMKLMIPKHVRVIVYVVSALALPIILL